MNRPAHVPESGADVRAVSLSVSTQSDTERARREARLMARSLGFGVADAEMVALATMELATNLLRYAVSGEIHLRPCAGPTGDGVRLESRDRGPGIPDLALALHDGFSTGGGLGCGLPGARRLMDDFEIESGPAGTTVVAYKWRARG